MFQYTNLQHAYNKIVEYVYICDCAYSVTDCVYMWVRLCEWMCVYANKVKLTNTLKQKLLRDNKYWDGV